MNDINKVLQTVRDVVSRRLYPAIVTDVSVKTDFDHDGDPILHITIVFQADGDKLQADKVLGLARHLREPLEKIGEDLFPVFTFMTPEEVQGAAA